MARLQAFLKGHWQLIGLCALVVALWQTDVVYPLRLLVVFFHELSHAAATILTGGRVEDFAINAFEGGHVMSRGGNRFLILSAGYVGSLLIGIALLLVAVRTQMDRAVLGGLGTLILLMTLLYIREPFAISFCVLTGAAMLATARFLPREINDLLLRVIGLSSMIYVPFDIVSDTIFRAYLQSDARMMAQEFGGATIIWGLIWLGISLTAIFLSLRYGLGPDSNVYLRRRSR